FCRLPAGPRPIIQLWPRMPNAGHLRAHGQGLILLALEPHGEGRQLFEQDNNGSASRPCYPTLVSVSNQGPSDGLESPRRRCLKSIDKLVKELETYWRDRAIRKPVRGVAGDVGAIPRQNREEVGEGVGGLYLDPHLPWDVQIPIEKMPRWVEPVEEYIALQIALFIREPLRHLAHLLTFVIGAAFMILLAITSYPFEPRSVMTI